MLDSTIRSAIFDQTNTTRSVNWADVLAGLLRRKWCLAIWISVSLGIGLVYLNVVQPTYEVAARVLVEPEGSPLEYGTSPYQEEEFLATQGEIISSRAVLERAVEGLKQPIMIEPGVDPVLAIQSRLAVKPLTGTHVLSVAFRFTDSADGICIVNAILDSYQQFLQKMNADPRLEALQLITRSEQQLRSELEEREKKYVELRRKSPLVGQGENSVNVQSSLLAQIGNALTEVRNRRINFQGRLEMLTNPESQLLLTQDRQVETMEAVSCGVVDGPHVDFINPSTFMVWPTSFNSNIESFVSLNTNSKFKTDSNNENIALDLVADLKLAGASDPASIFRALHLAQAREQELSMKIGPDHPTLRSVRAEVLAWKKRLNKLNDQAIMALKRETTAAENHEKRLVEIYESELQKTKADDEFLILEQQELDGIDRLKTIHDSVAVQLNNLRLMQPNENGAWGTKTTILETPSIGLGPIWPKRSMLLILCGLFGVLGGLGTIVMLERNTWVHAYSIGDHSSRDVEAVSTTNGIYSRTTEPCTAEPCTAEPCVR